jgi:hypothetical protein
VSCLDVSLKFTLCVIDIRTGFLGCSFSWRTEYNPLVGVKTTFVECYQCIHFIHENVKIVFS